MKRKSRRVNFIKPWSSPQKQGHSEVKKIIELGQLTISPISSRKESG
jgi:hypothetical protein